MSDKAAKAARRARPAGQQANLDKATVLFLNSMARQLVRGNKRGALVMSMAALGAEFVARDHAHPGAPIKMADVKADMDAWYVDLPEGRIFLSSAAVQPGDLELTSWHDTAPDGTVTTRDGTPPDPQVLAQSVAAAADPPELGMPAEPWLYYGVPATYWADKAVPCPRCTQEGMGVPPDPACDICRGYGKYMPQW